MQKDEVENYPMRHKQVAKQLDSLSARTDPVTIQIRNPRAAITMTARITSGPLFDKRKNCFVVKADMGDGKRYRLRCPSIISITR